jgi:hypothetical protein
MSADSAVALAHDVHMLELRVRTRISRNAAMHRFSEDAKVAELEAELAKLLARLATIMPSLSDEGKATVLAEMDLNKDVGERKAVDLAKVIYESELEIRNRLRKISGGGGNAKLEEDEQLCDMQRRLDTLTMELSQLLPSLDALAREAVIEACTLQE